VQVRARLLSECVTQHGKAFGGNEKLEKQCDCFAGVVVKSMSKDDREFYSQYGVVPTLTAARPDDVKKQCGINVIDNSGSRAKYPPPNS
jgi:predicted metalloprotease